MEEKSKNNDGLKMLLLALFSPLIVSLCFFPAVCAIVCEKLGIDLRVGYVIGALMTGGIIYDIATEKHHRIPESSVIGRDGLMHSE